MNIWLPREYRERQESLRRAGFLSFVMWGDVSSMPVDDTGEESLIRHVASLSADSLLAAIGAVSTILANGGWALQTIRQQQLAAAHELCEGEIAQRVEQLLASGQRDVFVHEPQLLVAAKLAVLYAQRDEDRPLPPGALGEFLLRINTLMANDEKPPATSMLPDDWAISLAVRRRGLLRNEQWRYLAPRLHDLLVTRAANDSIGTDFDRVFREQTGLSLEEYLAFAFLYSLPFTSAKTAEELLHTLGSSYLEVVGQINSHFPDATMLQRCLSLYADTLESAFAALSQVDGSSIALTSGFRQFKQYPLLKLVGGATVPVSLPLLQEKAAMGAYWTLYDVYRQNDPKEGVNTFTSAMGRLFQAYLTDLLARLCLDSETGQVFHTEEDIKRASGKKGLQSKPPFDAAISSSDSLVLIEMSSTTLTARLFDSGDPAAFRDEVESKYIKKARQLNQAFDGLAAGTWRIDGLDRSSIRHVYPVIGLLHPFPQAAVTLAPLIEAAKPAGWYAFGSEPIATAYVHPVQIITAEEFEILEPFLAGNKMALANILGPRASNPQTATVSMKNFLLNRLGWHEQLNQGMYELYKNLAQRIEQSLGIHLRLDGSMEELDDSNQ